MLALLPPAVAAAWLGTIQFGYERILIGDTIERSQKFRLHTPERCVLAVCPHQSRYGIHQRLIPGLRHCLPDVWSKFPAELQARSATSNQRLHSAELPQSSQVFLSTAPTDAEDFGP